MSKQGWIGDLLRHRIRSERERHDWSQAQVAQALSEHKIEAQASTVSKMESGERGVRADELIAFAEIFGLSVDVLVGRGTNGLDVVWAASRLTSTAHRMVGELLILQKRIADETQDLIGYADRDCKRESVADLVERANRAHGALHRARESLTAVARQFPLIGVR
jgi:transcriptional regulator with XRE-family HTH domain